MLSVPVHLCSPELELLVKPNWDTGQDLAHQNGTLDRHTRTAHQSRTAGSKLVLLQTRAGERFRSSRLHYLNLTDVLYRFSTSMEPRSMGPPHPSGTPHRHPIGTPSAPHPPLGTPPTRPTLGDRPLGGAPRRGYKFRRCPPGPFGRIEGWVWGDSAG